MTAADERDFEESLLIFNHVAASTRFVRALETKIRAKCADQAQASDEDDLPL